MSNDQIEISKPFSSMILSIDTREIVKNAIRLLESSTEYHLFCNYALVTGIIQETRSDPIPFPLNFETYCYSIIYEFRGGEPIPKGEMRPYLSFDISKKLLEKIFKYEVFFYHGKIESVDVLRLKHDMYPTPMPDDIREMIENGLYQEPISTFNKLQGVASKAMCVNPRAVQEDLTYQLFLKYLEEKKGLVK